MRAPNSFRGPIAFPWLKQVPDLVAFPQFAPLAALHSAASASIFAILAAHPKLDIPNNPANPDHRAIAATSLLGLIEALLVGLERYQAEMSGNSLLREPTPPLRFDDIPGLRIPSGWSPVTAVAVWEFLDALSRSVWEAHEPALVESAIRDCQMEEWQRCSDLQEQPETELDFDLQEQPETELDFDLQIPE